ncbi:TPA: 30S ribosomal protein S9, partial [Patescibacteria group bacterium]|nr:30S ribosomal protein S9 [Candidatus Gracilibacteria bacterium]HBY74517.1 30S ribosomal protein S9 [Candidatus Gracilibacteria bacterium]
MRLGISRALASLDPASKSTLRKAAFITRDSRKVERKKP